MIYPLAIGGACIITSIIGTWFVNLVKVKILWVLYIKVLLLQLLHLLLILYPVTNSIVGLSEELIIMTEKLLMD